MKKIKNKNGKQTVINLNIHIDQFNFSIMSVSFLLTISMIGIVLFG